MDLKRHINNPKIQKCISDAIERDNKRKRSIKIAWLKDHCIDLAALLIAILSLIVSILK